MAAVVVFAYRGHLQRRAEIIKSAPEKERLEAIVTTAEFFRVDTARLSRVQQEHIVLAQIHARARRDLLVTGVLLIFAVLLGAIAIMAIANPKPARSPFPMGIGGLVATPNRIDYLPANTSVPFPNANQEFWCYTAEKTGTVRLAVSNTANKVTLWAFEYGPTGNCSNPPPPEPTARRILQRELPAMPSSSAHEDVAVTKGLQYEFGIQPMDGVGPVTFDITAN